MHGGTGPKEKLDSTEISQPAIYVASFAALEKLKQTEGEVRAASHAILIDFTAESVLAFYACYAEETSMAWSLQDALQKADVACGLSLGEYTALAFAGAFRFACSFHLRSCSQRWQHGLDAARFGSEPIMRYPYPSRQRISAATFALVL